ncbi:MAG TPA: efflux RND transporter periplasmic adaptor subunit [Bryobacteraceae bacterium]|nr:efflux RND transporter periplasmic adaptor subunit [Bryobacteraceae bacterium]
MRRVFVWLLALAGLLTLGLGAWGSGRLYEKITGSKTVSIPSIAVKRGDVAFTIAAKGDLQGGNSEMLSAPMTGGGALAIRQLRESGELVKEGDIVAQFDTTEQEFKLREAEADLAEAEQQVTQATAESEAKEEEARLALLQARKDLKVAELEARRNELMPRITARQNELAVAAAADKVRQLEKDLNERIAAAHAGIAIQEAARSKAKVAAQTAQRNIDSMTLKAKTTGYVARQQNNDGNFRWGSYLPVLQVGDTVRAGMGVAQIPDLKNWEVTARIGELDRGHLSVGQLTAISVVALPGKKFTGKLKNIGGTTGPPWDRHFDTKISVENPALELRPGMSVQLLITTDLMKSVLWLPAQALFEADNRKFVYIHASGAYTRKDVKLVRRSESSVVVEGLMEGQLVALANPEQSNKSASSSGGAIQAIQR